MVYYYVQDYLNHRCILKLCAARYCSSWRTSFVRAGATSTYEYISVISDVRKQWYLRFLRNFFKLFM